MGCLTSAKPRHTGQSCSDHPRLRPGPGPWHGTQADTSGARSLPSYWINKCPASRLHQTQGTSITLPVFLVDALHKHLKDNVGAEAEAMLFTTYRGTMMRYNSWRVTHFDPAVAAAGLGHVTPKDLCATHGTWVADRHGVMAVAKRLRHSNASMTTRHYARAVEARDAEIARGFGVTAPEPQADEPDEG